MTPVEVLRSELGGPWAKLVMAALDDAGYQIVPRRSDGAAVVVTLTPKEARLLSSACRILSVNVYQELANVIDAAFLEPASMAGERT